MVARRVGRWLRGRLDTWLWENVDTDRELEGQRSDHPPEGEMEDLDGRSTHSIAPRAESHHGSDGGGADSLMVRICSV